MFSPISRYRRLPDVAALDAKGRVRASKSLRLPPATPGDALHTVEDSDRLDRLAYTYYKQPRDWWRIADANPAFLAPQALLGNTPWLTVQIPLTWDGPPFTEDSAAPSWSDLLRGLVQTLGVGTAALGTPAQSHAAVTVVEGPPLAALNSALTADLDESARAQALTPALEAALTAEGITFADVRIEAPDAGAWRLTERPARRVLTARWFAGEALLQAYDSAFRYDWSAEITYNRRVVAPEVLLALIEDQGFTPGPPAEVRRIGKSIVIPPRKG